MQKRGSGSKNMRKINLTDTIAAIATPIGEGGIGIVRISGENAMAVAGKIFLPKDGKKICSYQAYTTHYGWIVSGPANIIDEVLLTVMRAPKSYTKEDVVEINCHGGIVALRKVLEAALKNGCRMAQPGEFTKRAFLNGRIDLAQAEAVLDIVRAKTGSALNIAQYQLKGFLSQKISDISSELLEISASLEASIDFPDEADDALDLKKIFRRLQAVESKLKALISSSGRGRILREGIHTVICGLPNVGKSSLLNALLRQERSIVTHIAGTTRDIIEETIDIRGIPVKIVDTAGIVEPRDLAEKKAVSLAREQMESADLVILVFDGTKKLSQEDRRLIKKLKNKTVIAVINKSDLRQRIEKEEIIKVFGRANDISAKKFKNIELLEETVAELIYCGKIRSPEAQLAVNLRQAQGLSDAQKFIAEALNSLDNNIFIEYVAQSVRQALGLLDEILGRKFSEGLLDKIFSEFCIGK